VILNELPPTIYIGFGAIIAAAITAIVSFINLITSKDQNISNHRQKWIDNIREDISKFIGLVAHKTSVLHWLKLEENKELNKKELKTKLFSEVDSDIASLYNRILLQLNPTENKDIIDKFTEIESFLRGYDSSPKEDVNRLGTLTSDLRDSTQIMLKSEWKRVKKGEPTYRVTHFSF